MTFGEHNPTEEDLVDRLDEIVTYLQSYPPDVRLKAMHGSYGETPNPITLPHYCLMYQMPWQAVSIQERQHLPLEFSLNADICELIQKCDTDESQSLDSLIYFLLKVVIIHELAHVVMYTFVSQDTPQRFHGNGPLEANAARGEAGDSMEMEMIGGEVNLAIPSDYTIQTINPSDLIIVVRMTRGNEECKILNVNTSNLTDIASGNWSHIHNLPTQPFPNDFQDTKLKSKLPSLPAPSSSHHLCSYIIWEPWSDPNIPGVKR
ncbi:uncharacterized protein BJ212DRAFT_1478130 [Suillus subaureus]|uniref:SprT-like domain-containing protein n=1 Tax=Suillus subaureus TaxID=48587 RepID=A0A9P7EHJ2_9AGAM|nr:uncharacterized protein BJ212DRAFT_1478130 [Suillus subaureus]KAG1821030.1 hypothetical protein BJ212DRAFT_1478130 [Suillus subaureus]